LHAQEVVRACHKPPESLEDGRIGGLLDQMNATRATDARFEATRWTLVIEAQSPSAREALNELCRIYWPPIYAFIRRQGFPPSDAADLTQDFFGHILAHQALSTVAREKGKFRSFLQKSLTNFLNNERDRAGAKKRGGDRTIVSIDTEAEEERHPLELTDASDPIRVFDRRWGLAVVNEVMLKLERKHSAPEKGAVFAQLKPWLTGEVGEGIYAALATTLNMTQGAVKTTLHRLRREFGELLWIEVRHSLANPSEQDIRDEIGHLFACIGD
jgi:DNA-directed RNA polymerase specialized sigma24 family protein